MKSNMELIGTHLRVEGTAVACFVDLEDAANPGDNLCKVKR